MKKLTFSICFLLCSFFLSAQNYSSTFFAEKISPSTSRDTLPLKKSRAHELRWSVLYLNINTTLLAAVRIKGELNLENYEYGSSFYPWADKKIELSYWNAFNRYCWIGFDYTNALSQINYIYQNQIIRGADAWDKYYYEIKSVNTMHGVSAKIGAGNSWVSNNGKAKNASAMLSTLLFAGVRSTIISSQLTDDGTIRETYVSGDRSIGAAPINATTNILGSTNFVYGFFAQLSVYKVCFNFGLEAEKTPLPLGISAQDKVSQRSLTIKTGIGIKVK